MGITVVGLGPGNGRLLTREAWDILSTSPIVYVRTERHPAVADLPSSVEIINFDHFYETADRFEDVYSQIVDELLRLGRDQQIIYAVPGHPFVGESTVTALVAAAAAAQIPVTVISGISFVETSLTAVALDGLDGLQLFDALEIVKFKHPPVSTDVPLLLGQVYSRLLASEVKMALSVVYPEEHQVSLVHAAGTDRQLIETVPLYAIDRSQTIDHLTSLLVPPLPYRSTLPALAETVAILRSPEGCPWDQEQTPQSMRAGLLEEVAELLDALDREDHENLCEELGDIIYHLVMQVQMASEEEIFRISDVIGGIDTKLRRRHPHVWGDWEVNSTAEVLHNWEQLKQEEKNHRSHALLESVPSALPALARSQKIQKKVSGVGFDWPDVSGVYEKIDEELRELRAAATPDECQAELGDVLFALANLAQWLGVDAESALREANLRFSKRFGRLEELLLERSLKWEELDLAALDDIWREVKEMLAKEE